MLKNINTNVNLFLSLWTTNLPIVTDNRDVMGNILQKALLLTVLPKNPNALCRH